MVYKNVPHNIVFNFPKDKNKENSKDHKESGDFLRGNNILRDFFLEFSQKCKKYPLDE